MGDTAISWTDKTWNPLTGCTRVSAGCDHCYAFQLHDTRHVAWKRGRMPNAAPQYHQPFSRVQLFPERLTQPLRWRKPARIFVNSMSDLFHEAVPDEFIARVFAVMALARQHTFQVLTKRPERMAHLLNLEAWRAVVWATRENIGRLNWVDWDSSIEPGWPPPNVHLGTSIEDQTAADERIPWLLRTPAAVRFLSAEPLLGAINLNRWMGSLECCSVCEEPKDRTKDAPGNETALGWPRCVNLRCVAYGEGVASAAYRRMIHWVICGGESGPHARPMHPEWVRSLRDQCVEAGVKFHFKQWGEWAPPRWAILDKHLPFDPYLFMNIEGKRRAGRELDGRTWDEFPETP